MLLCPQISKASTLSFGDGLFFHPKTHFTQMKCGDLVRMISVIPWYVFWRAKHLFPPDLTFATWNRHATYIRMNHRHSLHIPLIKSSTRLELPPNRYFLHQTTGKMFSESLKSWFQASSYEPISFLHNSINFNSCLFLRPKKTHTVTIYIATVLSVRCPKLSNVIPGQ